MPQLIYLAVFGGFAVSFGVRALGACLALLDNAKHVRALCRLFQRTLNHGWISLRHHAIHALMCHPPGFKARLRRRKSRVDSGQQ